MNYGPMLKELKTPKTRAQLIELFKDSTDEWLLCLIARGLVKLKDGLFCLDEEALRRDRSR